MWLPGAGVGGEDLTAKHAKGAKEEHCHFERREKSFLDPSHSLGMTGFWPVTLRPWREEFPNQRTFDFRDI